MAIHKIQNSISANCQTITRDYIDVFFKNIKSRVPLNYHVWGAMLEKFQKLNPKTENVSDLKMALQVIWDSLPEETICKSVVDFRKRLIACVKTDGEHF